MGPLVSCQYVSVPEVAVAELYRVEYAQLMRVAFCLTGSNEVAEDLVHDTFVRCSARLPEVANPGGYLQAALVNACRSYHRRQVLDKRRAAYQLPGEDMPRQLVELRDVLLKLPLKQRSAVVLRYLVGLDDDETADILGCSRSTVRTLVARALRCLRKDLS